MPDSSQQDMSAGRAVMNGHRPINGVSPARSPAFHPNGGANAVKNPTVQAATTGPSDSMTLLANGADPAPPLKSNTKEPNMEQVQAIVQDVLQLIPDTAYVSVAQMIKRAGQQCWTDLVNMLDYLSEIELQDSSTIMNRLPQDREVINDTSERNREKKMTIFNFAETHKRVLVKLLVILQWSAKSEDNRLTIALNFYIHQLRIAFYETNDQLAAWIEYTESRQDACPDLATAFEMLAKGRIAGLPERLELEYGEQKALTDRQMLSTIRRLNTVLCTRMTMEDSLPEALRDWHVHDGRVTFHVSQEFDLDLSVMDEELDSQFLFVDVRFNYRPAPFVADDINDDITKITNAELASKGLRGAHTFLHELTLSRKLTELHKQATVLAEGSWSGNLRIEMHKRTLVVQYWTRRPTSKSWIEIVIHSGRAPLIEHPVSFLALRWMRHGKLVADHDVDLDLTHLSFVSIISQVVAQHANSIFDGIYDQLITTKLFASNELDIEQSSSLSDANDCDLSIEVSKGHSIQVSCDPVAGTLFISPASERSNRVQAEVARSKNVVDDFIARFHALRTGLAHAKLLKAISFTSWQYLPGRKPTYVECRELFNNSVSRASFFRHPEWSGQWVLAACFGSDGDSWWLVANSPGSVNQTVAQPTDFAGIHLQQSLTPEYFDQISQDAIEVVTAQANKRNMLAHGLRNVVVSRPSAHSHKRVLKFRLAQDKHESSIGDVTLTSRTSRCVKMPHWVEVIATLLAPIALLKDLSAVHLGSNTRILPEQLRLQLRVPCKVGEPVIDDLKGKLHYIDNLISCMKVVNKTTFKIASLSMQKIVITYQHGYGSDLQLALTFDTADTGHKVLLLPADTNPHKLVTPYIDSELAKGTEALHLRLKRLLTFLRLILPMLNVFQYLQGLVSTQQVPEMEAVNLVESKKWLRIHVMPRELLKYALHIHGNTSSFRRDVHGSEIPDQMLARFEIELQLGNGGALPGWIIRPAIEEFRTYTRPSFNANALRERLQRQIFAVTTHKGWEPLDSAAKCHISNPEPLLTALHKVVLEWFKEAVAEYKEAAPQAAPDSVATQAQAPPQQQQQQQQQQARSQPQAQPQSQPQPTKQQLQHGQRQSNIPNQQAQQRQQVAMLAQQQQRQRQQMANMQQGRPANMGVNMGRGTNPNSGPNTNQNTNGLSRVMTAAPQQVRQPPMNGQQRRQMQNSQARMNGQQQQQNQQRTIPHPNDVINLD